VAEPLVQIEGLRELRLDLIRLDKEYFVKAMVEAGSAVAEPAAGAIRGALPSRSGTLRGTVRPGKVRTGAIVRTGLARAPYVGPVEFGGWPRGRTFLPGGRYIFPTARGFTDRAASTYEREIESAINRYPWSHP
jgi:hypothetical protein